MANRYVDLINEWTHWKQRLYLYWRAFLLVMILNSTGLVCTHQSNAAKLENACEDQEAASARGEEAVDIVTPVATILNQTVRFTKALIEINWQEGQRTTYNIFLALSEDKRAWVMLQRYPWLSSGSRKSGVSRAEEP